MGKKQGGGKSAQLGIDAQREDDFGKWYTQIVTRASLIEYYDISGCYILVGGTCIHDRRVDVLTG